MGVRGDAARRRCAAHAAQVIDQDKVVPDTPGVVEQNAIEHLDHRADVHHQPGFLQHFPRAGLFERLAELHAAAWEIPRAFERLVGALHEHDPAVDENHRPDADDRTIRIAPVSRHGQAPITFTMTRFLRCPSNSA